jgi:CHAT domain-containing protein
MAWLYEGMEKDGMRPAAALRSAQIKIIGEKKWSRPFFWAAFGIQGEWQ